MQRRILFCCISLLLITGQSQGFFFPAFFQGGAAMFKLFTGLASGVPSMLSKASILLDIPIIDLVVKTAKSLYNEGIEKTFEKIKDKLMSIETVAKAVKYVAEHFIPMLSMVSTETVVNACKRLYYFVRDYFEYGGSKLGNDLMKASEAEQESACNSLTSILQQKRLRRCTKPQSTTYKKISTKRGNKSEEWLETIERYEYRVKKESSNVRRRKIIISIIYE